MEISSKNLVAFTGTKKRNLGVGKFPSGLKTWDSIRKSYWALIHDDKVNSN